MRRVATCHRDAGWDDFGGLVAMPVGMSASLLFGAFEVVLPVMTTGMLGGMVTPMGDPPLTEAAARGAAVGIGVLAASAQAGRPAAHV